MDDTYILCLLSTDEDMVILTKQSCQKCCERKLKTRILKTWNLDKTEVIPFKKLKVRILDVSCDCEK